MGSVSNVRPDYRPVVPPGEWEQRVGYADSTRTVDERRRGGDEYLTSTLALAWKNV